MYVEQVTWLRFAQPSDKLTNPPQAVNGPYVSMRWKLGALWRRRAADPVFDAVFLDAV